MKSRRFKTLIKTHAIAIALAAHVASSPVPANGIKVTSVGPVNDYYTTPDTIQTSIESDTTTTTIIDILSSSAQFSIVLSHLQRHGLIPLINEARNITFFAPSNDAFLDVPSEAVTEDLLRYHILNATFLTKELEQYKDIGLTSAMHPSYLISTEFKTPTTQSKKHPKPAPHLANMQVLINKSPNPDKDADEPFIYSVGSSPNAPAHIVEPDLKASKTRGIVHVVNKLMQPPKPVCELLRDNPNTQLFFAIFAAENDCTQPVFTAPSTLFVPSDTAFAKQLSDVERDYLLSEWARDDRRALLKRHTAGSLLVASPLVPDLAKDTRHSDKALLHANDGSAWSVSAAMTVNDTLTATAANRLAADGVVHSYDAFLAADGGNVHSLLNLSAEKHLLVLGAAAFVREVEFRGLSGFINGTMREKQTVLAPVEDADSVKMRFALGKYQNTLKETQNTIDEDQNTLIDHSNTFRESPLPSNIFAESIPSTLYHFVDGQYHFDVKEIANSNYLLTSKASLKRLGYGFQRIKVTAEEDTGDIYLNYHDKILSGPYVVGNTSIYLIDGFLDVPPSLDLAVGSVLQASRSASYLDQLGLLSLPSSNGWTVLLPTTVAWKRLGLVTTYLESNTTALRSVLESHILKVPFYSNSETTKTELYNGKNVTVSTRPVHGKRELVASSYSSHLSDIGYYPLNIYVNELEYRVESANVLSNSGVIHSVNSITIPDSVTIGVEHILNSIDATLFVDLLVARNMSHVLSPGASYTILAPSNKVLTANNISVDTPHIDTLLRLLILPSNPVDKLFRGDETESLQENVHLSAREVDVDMYVVKIVESSSNHEIRVLNRGDTSRSTHASGFSTVLYVDNFFSPDWVARPPFIPPFRLRTSFAILLGVVFGAILIFFAISVALLFFLGSRRKSSQSGAATAPGTAEGSPDRRPLLSRKSSAVSASSRRHRGHRSHNGSPPDPEYGATGEAGDSGSLFDPSHTRHGSTRSMSSLASEHSVSEPIPTGKVQGGREHGKHLNLPRVA